MSDNNSNEAGRAPGPVHFKLPSEMVLDRFGKELEPGCAFYWIGKTDVIWQLASARKSVRPDLPAGTLEITLTAHIRTGVIGGVPNLDLLKCMSKEECDAVMAKLGPGAV